MLLNVGGNSELTFNKVPGGCWWVLRSTERKANVFRRSNCVTLTLIKKGICFKPEQ